MLLSFVVGGSMTLGETGELGTSPQFRAGGFIETAPGSGISGDTA